MVKYDYNELADYLKDIGRFPLLSFEEELDLARRNKNGDAAAQKKLIESNLRLVVNIAKKYQIDGFTLLDIIQEGNLGLITAAQKYDASYNVRFSTYACWWIKQSISRAIMNKRRLIRLPFRREELAARIRRVSNLLYQKNSRYPSMEEIAAETGMTARQVSDILQNAEYVASLDVSADDDDSATLNEMIPDMTYNPEEIVMKKYTKVCMKEMLDTLKKREREVLDKRYNLTDDRKTYTFKMLGNRYGVSAETVRQIELRALRKLRKNSEGMKEVLYS
ncbi:RNA polymerase sigma factor RpoD/SigA [Brucepastera parasyntrophica]|uniref:sigma-70 family RNA polymerase sigma factor n=1 Tax=Brucepastera parasyntrophica TaxID=2880008 RepID=UPI002109786C|nr:RNA polymerase sigma factor RpoD/SigA [Brucepastera parasyntrophica]ULQ60505.1 RNA polymerase sigma factor RpoD/SigA [Brucepastera parasyntrophica]